MAAGQKLYPRATVKKIVKAHTKRNVGKNVDVLVSIDATCDESMDTKSDSQIFLDYNLFLQEYATIPDPFHWRQMNRQACPAIS